MLSDVMRLREMLREARRWLPFKNPLADQIDAELEKPAIEWMPDTFWGEDAVEARVDGFYLSVHPIPFEDGDSWDWDVSRSEVAESGSAPTKEAAIAAAIKAVRARL